MAGSPNFENRLCKSQGQIRAPFTDCVFVKRYFNARQYFIPLPIEVCKPVRISVEIASKGIKLRCYVTKAKKYS